VIVALGKQLSTHAHPQEQVYAYSSALRTVLPWLEKVYFLFPEEAEDRPKRVFLCERKSQGLTILGWQALTPDEQELLEGVLAKGRRKKKRKAGVQEVAGAGEGPLALKAAIPLSLGSGPEGWVVFAGTKAAEGAWGREDMNAVSVCTDMLSASLDRARLFENVLLAKKEWERTADAIRDVVMIVDRDWVVRRGNRLLAELGGVPVEGLQGNRCHALLASREEICVACPAVVTLETGQEATAEVFREERDAIFQVWSYPILDPSGNLESVAVYEKDITEYKWMQQKLVHAEKMGVLGQLAAAVAHELNNPLSGVISFSQILLKEMDPGLPYVEDVKNIEHAALRCKKIVEDLLAFSRKPETGVHEPVGLEGVVDQVLNLLRPKLEAKGARVEKVIPASLPRIPVHPDPLHQILVNLISNALDAIEEEGALKLKARQAKDKGGKYILLAIQDTGAGIPSRDMKKIFEPFFTTKGPGEGTGLGLSICRKLMESFGGSIEVSSSSDKGTTFSLKFPLARE
jgi:two-component system NtrC family sensor kinase